MPTRMLLHVRPEYVSRLGLHADLMRQYDEFLARKKALSVLAPTTTMACHCDARRFLIYYSTVQVRYFTAEHIERYLVHRSSKNQPSANFTEFNRLRTLFRWLVEEQRLLRENPCDRVPKIKFHPKPRPAPSLEEFKRLCFAARSLEEVLLVETLYYTGLRVRELCSLRERQVDLTERWITVTGKGARTYTIPFPPHLADLLGAWMVGESAGWVFRSQRYRGQVRPHRAEWIGKILHRLSDEAGLSYRVTAHLLRHGLARALKTSEMPIAIIQQVMRHRNIQTTINMYGRLQTDDLRRAYDRYLTGRE